MKRTAITIAAVFTALAALPASLWLAALLWPAPQSYPAITPFSWQDTQAQWHSLSESQAPFTLLFLGFLSCQNVCPARLGELAGIARTLPSGTVQVLYVTLEPNTDTPALRQRHIDSLGVKSGRLSPEALSQLRRELRDNSAAKSPAHHVNRVYLLHRSGKLAAVFNQQPLQAEAITQQLSTLSIL
ncbi:SCO family protein [Gilvimarinus xylanilyticus]|uniref:SCO family protein n=1 Tax=Gilvimarinus xylanilyticus TaxID=2944139 RepID=A0A9X2HZM4_9GAMM|nr:SCO family protein [Gilvimarinus xylanilyticus]MCP8900679.1 SCO family protein [Gilvimarinus xylanilyticus]